MIFEDIFGADSHDTESLRNDAFLFMFLQFFDVRSLVVMCRVCREWAAIIHALRDKLQIVHRRHNVDITYDQDTLLLLEYLCGRRNAPLDFGAPRGVNSVELWLPCEKHLAHRYPYGQQRVTFMFHESPAHVYEYSCHILLSKVSKFQNTVSPNFSLVFKQYGRGSEIKYDEIIIDRSHRRQDLSTLLSSHSGRRLAREKWIDLLVLVVRLDLLEHLIGDRANYPANTLYNDLVQHQLFPLKNHFRFSQDLEMYGWRTMTLSEKKKMLEAFLYMKIIPLWNEEEQPHGVYSFISYHFDSVIWSKSDLKKPMKVRHLGKEYHDPRVIVQGSDVVLEFWKSSYETTTFPPRCLTTVFYTKYEVRLSNSRSSIKELFVLEKETGSKCLDTTIIMCMLGCVSCLVSSSALGECCCNRC